MEKLLFWIDDAQKTRIRQVPEGASKKCLENGLNVRLEIKTLSSFEEFEEIANAMPVDVTYGVLMDYQLIKVGSNGNTEYGTTWAAHLRAQKPCIPIIGLSSEKESSIPRFRMENFLAFFKRGELISNPPLGQLTALFQGYRTVWSNFRKMSTSSGVDIMVKLLKAPPAAEKLLRSTIPPFLREKWDPETPHAAARWIWHDLQGRPGFLFDELETATYFGITENAFCTVSGHQHFEAARYKGFLVCDERPRWWVSLLRGAAEKIIERTLVGPTAASRSDLLAAFDIPEENRLAMFAVPRRRNSFLPECVAFPDQDSKNSRQLDKRVTALWRDTIVDEVDANPPPGFQAPRHFKFNANL